MLVGFFFNITILYSIYGYSYVYKKYILDDNDSLKNIDFFFGLFFIYLLSLIFNFFSGISIFVWPIHFIGLIFFIFCYFKKKIEIKFFILSAIIFIFTFLAYTNGNNVDSPMYHLQILKWLEHEKIIFGLANLEIRFAMNSSWHNIISLLNLNFYSFASKFYLTPILLGVMINELFTLKKNNKNSYYFLLLSTLTLLFYNLLHPFHNGIIFNHLGNPEFDIATLVFFICFLYVVFVFEEVKNKKNYLQLLFILIFFSITSRLTNIPIILVGLFYLFNYKNINNKFNLILIAICSFFWFLRNFILSGCILFPIKETCLNTSWTVNLADVTKHKNEVLSWTRGYSSGNHDNYDFTINSYDWIYPWFQSYFFKDALLQIFSILIILVIFLTILLNLLNLPKKKFHKIDYLISLVFISIFFIWFLAPEIRYGWGPILSFPAFLFYLLLRRFNFKYLLFRVNRAKDLILMVFLVGIFLKATNYFNTVDIFKLSVKNFNYSKINKVKEVNGFEIYKSENWQCADYKNICVNTIKKEYKFDKKFGYLIISSN